MIVKKSITCCLIALIAVSCFSGLRAGEIESGKELIINDKKPWLVKPTIDLRFRYEYGDQDGLDVSHAETGRGRFGLLSREINGFQAFGEYEGTAALDRQGYRAASVHGPATKTVIADPESHELNQLWLSHKGSNYLVKAGRQAIALDNQRYVGGVAWRQNMQTFDGATLEWSPSDDLSVYYGYVSRVNRIFGSDVVAPPQTDFEGDTHLVNVKVKNNPFGNLTAYAYLMDLENQAGFAQSNNTFGFYLTGPVGCHDDITYYMEYAFQEEGDNSPLDYEANYGHGYVSAPLVGKLTGTIGMEYLEEDFRTPLATAHKFNGFADRFYVASLPAGGLTDLYGSIGTALPFDFKGSVFYHAFWDDDMDVDYGHEVDLVLTRKLTDDVLFLTKGAWFMGDNGFPDTTRFSVELNYKY